MKTTREKFKKREKLGFREKKCQISLPLLPDCFLDVFQKGVVCKHRTTH